MQRQQLELWASKGAELLPVPPPYRELTPEQRHQIIGRLARLILEQVRIDPNINTETHPNINSEPPISPEPTDRRLP